MSYQSQKFFDVLIIGGGINGLATLFHLCQSNISRVGLIEKFMLGHDQGSSHGSSRIIRTTYSDPNYVQLMQAAHLEWSNLEHTLHEQLIFSNPSCYFGPEGKNLNCYVEAIKGRGLDIEILDPDEARKRFPQFTFHGSKLVLCDYTAGVIAAFKTIQALIHFARSSKANLFENTPVLSINPLKSHIEVLTTQGKFFTEKLILTLGTGFSDLIPELKNQLTVINQTVAYFKLKNSQENYQIGKFPNWSYVDDRDNHTFYGLPEFDSDGIKVARHVTKPLNQNFFNQMERDRFEIEWLLRFIKDQFKDPLEKLMKVEHCFYTNTKHEDFIIDYYPIDHRILIGSACSGHAFKFAPLTGRILSDLALNSHTEISEFNNMRKQLSFS